MEEKVKQRGLNTVEKGGTRGSIFTSRGKGTGRQVEAMMLSGPGVLVRVSIPGQTIMSKKQVGEERVYSVYTSTLLFITKGSPDRNSHRAGTWRQELMQRPWRDVTYWLASLGLLSLPS